MNAQRRNKVLSYRRFIKAEKEGNQGARTNTDK